MVSPLSGQLWTVDPSIEVRPKKFTNAAGSGWENNEWILPALNQIEGGPIQDSGGMCLTVVGDIVELRNKEMYNKQLWKTEGGVEFRLKNEAGSHYLTAVTTGSLAGKFSILQIISNNLIHSHQVLEFPKIS